MSKLRDKIAKAVDIQTEIVDVPEWDTKVGVHGLSGRERSFLMKTYYSEDGQMDVETFYPALLIACVVDPETNEKVFTEEDVEMLKDKSGAVLENVAQVALRLSGLLPKSVDEAGKSFSSTQSGASTSS